jgi:undecaprenyl-diphosphatase
LLFGLAATVWLVHRRLGIAAFIWTAIVDLGRVYELYHFPSDIVGGAALGVLVVCLAQNRLTLAAGEWGLCWLTRAPAWFYMTAFVFSYLVATLFDDLRTIGRGSARALVTLFLDAAN